jgi:hypothetical protein
MRGHRLQEHSYRAMNKGQLRALTTVVESRKQASGLPDRGHKQLQGNEQGTFNIASTRLEGNEQETREAVDIELLGNERETLSSHRVIQPIHNYRGMNKKHHESRDTADIKLREYEGENPGN